MTQEKRTAKPIPKEIAESTSKKVLSFLNAAQSAEEIASAIEIKGERDVGVKVAESILDRRARLGGFQNLDQVAATPQVGEVRFSQILKALEARKESATNYIIEGLVKTAEKIDFAGERLTVIPGDALAQRDREAREIRIIRWVAVSKAVDDVARGEVNRPERLVSQVLNAAILPFPANP